MQHRLQIAIAQRIAQREGLSMFTLDDNGAHGGGGHLGVIAHVGGHFVALVNERGGIGPDHLHQLTDGAVVGLFLERLEAGIHNLFGFHLPITVIHAQCLKGFGMARLGNGFVKSLSLIAFAGADEQLHAVPFEGFEQRGQIGEAGAYVGGLGGAVITQEITVLEPNDFAGAKKRKRLEGLAQPAQDADGFTGIGCGRLHNLMVLTTHGLAPALVNLPGAA